MPKKLQTMREAILSVLKAAEDGRTIPKTVLAFLKREVKQPKDIWLVGPDRHDSIEEDYAPDLIRHGTQAERWAWADAIESTNGWTNPRTFPSLEEAENHVRELKGKPGDRTKVFDYDQEADEEEDPDE